MLTFTLYHYCPLPDPLESVVTAGLASARLLSWSLHSAWNAHPSLARLAFFSPPILLGLDFLLLLYQATGALTFTMTFDMHWYTLAQWHYGYEAMNTARGQSCRMVIHCVSSEYHFIPPSKKVSVCLIRPPMWNAQISVCQSWHYTTQISQLTHDANKGIIRRWNRLAWCRCV